MKIDNAKLNKFIKNARKTIGKSVSEPFSPEEVYSIALTKRINGFLYL